MEIIINHRKVKQEKEKMGKFEYMYITNYVYVESIIILTVK